jgi:cytochrome o ubiquinol oxidase subunit IV
MHKAASYITGFALSVVLTFAAFFAVVYPEFLHLGSKGVISTIILLAVVQCAVQLVCFLHIGVESGARWNLFTFISALGVILIVVLGSLWIMYHLNYNMTPADMNAYIFHDENMMR